MSTQYLSKKSSRVIAGFLVLGLVASAGYVLPHLSIQIPSSGSIASGIGVTSIPISPKLIKTDHPLVKDKIDAGKLAKVSLPFVENQGQTDPKIKFYAKTFGGTVYVTDSGLTYSLTKDSTAHQDQKSLAVNERFISETNLNPKGLDKSTSSVNYFVGDKKDWRTYVPTYNSISLGFVWPSIEVQLHAYGNNLEKIFTVNPGSSPDEIKLAFDGINSLGVDKGGKLLLDTDLGTIYMTKPVAYQYINAQRELVDVSYDIHGTTYGFVVGNYDNNYPLYIDPLLASTFIGGSSREYPFAITLDGSDDVYIAGTTASPNFPTTVGAYNQTFGSNCSLGGCADAFVSKLDSNLTTLVASTLIGGNDLDIAHAITLDGSGNVYIAGNTASSNFPTTVGAYNRTIGVGGSGHDDAFVSKLSPSLDTILASTFIGGNIYDQASAITLDGSGNVYIVGSTQSHNFPTTVGAYNRTFAGGSSGSQEVFVSELTPSLDILLDSTFVGGTGTNTAEAITYGSGNVYIAGSTNSANFPTTVGAYNRTYSGEDDDAFVSKLDSSLRILHASTYIGGNFDDIANAITLDGSGNVYIAGNTGSSNFPTIVGAYNQTYGGGGTDAFVSKLDSSLNTLQASTFIGGSFDDYANAITLDGSGNVYIAGYTASSDFPTTMGGYNQTYDGGPDDAFVSKLDSSLNTLQASTYLGGNSTDFVNAIAVDGADNVYIAGSSNSANFPTTVGAYNRTNSGGDSDVFVSKLTGTHGPGFTGLDLKDKASCEAAPLSGTWASANSTCQINGLKLNPGSSLIVDNSVDSFIGLINTGILDNNGTIKNDGTINTSGTINNNGIINNDGIITNSGTINNNGTIANNSGPGIDNFGTITNNGNITTTGGNINNNGTINNNSGGTVSNGYAGSIENNYAGSITNSGTIIIGNEGSIFNNGGIIHNLSDGTITNYDSIDNFAGTINNFGTIANFGGLSNLCGAVFSGILPTGDPIYNAACPTISINNVSLTEGNSGTKNFNFTVTWINTTSGTSSVNFTTADGTATVADSDYVANSGTINFGSGQTTKTITILVNGDTKVEPDETFFVNLLGCVACNITNSHGVGTILNDDSSTITGTVYNDTNNNGLQDGGESGIAGVRVIAVDLANLGTVLQTITNASGTYSFNNLTASHTFLVQVAPVPTLHLPSAGHHSFNYAVLSLGQNIVNFPFLPITGSNPATINGTVFNDTNNNGVQDPGEKGLNNTQVFVVDFLTLTQKTVHTNVNGTYNVTGVLPDIVLVQAAPVPAGFLPINGTHSFVYPPSLVQGSITTVNFPLRPVNSSELMTINATVFNDTNSDGVKQVNETGLSGVQVFSFVLLTAEQQNKFTDVNGTVIFHGVTPDVTLVQVVTPVNQTDTSPPVTSTSGLGFKYFNFPDVHSAANLTVSFGLH